MIVALFLMLFSVGTLAVFDWLFAVWILFCLSIIVIVYPLVSLYFLKEKTNSVKGK